MNTLDIIIPFGGFCEHWFNADIDSENEVREAEGLEPSHNFDFAGFSKEYASQYTEFLSDKYQLGLTCDRLSLTKDYFSGSDVISGTIPAEKALEMKQAVDHDALAALVKERHSSRSGFWSFYPNSLMFWPESVLDWDDVQLETLLICFIEHLHGDELSDVELYFYGDFACNGGVLDFMED